MATFKSATTLCDQIEKDKELMEKFKTEPLPMLMQIARFERERFHNDKLIYRAIVLILCSILILIVLYVLAIHGYYEYVNIKNLPNEGLDATKQISKVQPNPLPDYIIAVASTVLGALAGLLAPSPQDREGS